MAKVNRRKQYSGTLGGKTHFIRDGKEFIKEKSSLDRDRVMKGKEFANSRKSMGEFGHASALSKILRNSLSQFAPVWADGKLANRLQSAVLNHFAHLPGERGKRKLYLPSGSLHAFPLSASKQPANLFTVKLSPDRKVINLDSTNLNYFDPEKFPESSTHFQLTLIVVMLSSLEPKGRTKKLQPNFPDIHGKSFIAQANWPISEISSPESLELGITFEGSEPFPADQQLVIFAGIYFFQKIRDVEYVMRQHAMGWCIGVF